MPARTSRRILAGALLLLVLAAVAGGLARARVQTDVHAFLPAADASVEQYDALAREYGGDPVAVLLESPEDRGLFGEDTLPRLVRMEGALAALPGVSAVYGPGTMLNQVAGQTQDLLAELAGRRDAEIQRAIAQARQAGASPATAQAAGRAARDRFDTRYGPLVVQGLPGGAPTLRNTRFVERVLFDGAGRVRSQWRFLVPRPDAAAVLVRPEDDLDAAATARLVERVRRTVARDAPPAKVSVAGAPVLVGAMADTVSHDVPRLGLFAVALVALALAGATWVRRSRRWAPLGVTLVAMVGTVAVLGWADRPLSLGVVAFGTVLLGVGCYYPGYVTVGARTRTVFVVALATAASLATLVLSPIPLVQDLGIALGVGVLLSAGLAWLVRGWLTAGLQVAPTTTREPVTRPRWAIPALVAAAAAAAVGWLHLGDLDVRADVAEFAGGLPAYAESEHVSDVLGSSGELDLALRGPDVTSPAALAWQRRAQDGLVARDGERLRLVVSAPSMLRFLGSDATAGQIEAALRLLPPYLTQTAITPDRGTALVSFAVRLEDLSSLRPAVAHMRDLVPPAGYRTEVVGLPVVALRAEDLLQDDLLTANVLAVLVSGLVLALGLRRRTDALRAVTAAALATGTGFLLLWLTGTALNPVTAALGALTAAAGCEFSVVQAEARRAGSTVLRRSVLIGVATSVTGYLVMVPSHLHAVRGLGVTLAVATLLALGASWLVVLATTSSRNPRPVPAPAPPHLELVRA